MDSDTLFTPMFDLRSMGIIELENIRPMIIATYIFSIEFLQNKCLFVNTTRA